MMRGVPKRDIYRLPLLEDGFGMKLASRRDNTPMWRYPGVLKEIQHLLPPGWTKYKEGRIKETRSMALSEGVKLKSTTLGVAQRKQAKETRSRALPKGIELGMKRYDRGHCPQGSN